MTPWHCLSLYNIAVKSLVEWKYFDIKHLKDLPGIIKEDLLRVALLRGKCQTDISYFLHPNVKRLDISGCTITDKDLENISLCPKIRSLEMNPSKYNRYDHPSATLVIVFTSLHHLVKLHIQRNDGMTDSVMSALTSHCPLLQELDISSCTNLTNESAKALGILHFIKALNISDTLISNCGLFALSFGDSSKSLSELMLNNCIKVSDEGINALVQGCKKLSILVFSGCPKVSVECQLALDSFLNKDKKSKLVTWTVYF